MKTKDTTPALDVDALYAAMANTRRRSEVGRDQRTAVNFARSWVLPRLVGSPDVMAISLADVEEATGTTRNGAAKALRRLRRAGFLRLVHPQAFGRPATYAVNRRYVEGA